MVVRHTGNNESHEMFGLEFSHNNDMKCEMLREVKDFLTYLKVVLNLEFFTADTVVTRKCVCKKE